jgi:1-acyl-sn-glycerol-3-phosphate acyltransferase
VLPRQLDFAWRVIGTGLGFVVFLGGGSLLAVVAFPVIDLLTPEPSQRRERYHALMRWAFRAFVGMLHGLRVIEVEIDDPVALRGSKGVIVIANHPTLIDIVLLSAFIPRAQCIVKRELWDSPFLGRLMRGSGYIPNDLEPEALVAACRAALADGRSLIVFPEGTRSRPGMKLRFHRGFAQLATLLEADIQLALISCTPPTLTKGEKWWAVPSRRPHFRVSPAGWIRAVSWQGNGYRSLAARDITRRVERFYNEQLATG